MGVDSEATISSIMNVQTGGCRGRRTADPGCMIDRVVQQSVILQMSGSRWFGRVSPMAIGFPGRVLLLASGAELQVVINAGLAFSRAGDVHVCLCC
jgi:hypothetical protein